MSAPGARLWREPLLRARWFQGKGLPIDGLTWRPLPWYVAQGNTWVRSELITAHTGDDEATYHLLVGYLTVGAAEPAALIGQAELPGRGLVDVVDAPHSPAAMAAFLSAVAGASLPNVNWLDAPPDPNAKTTVFAGEQTNTTVQIGDNVLFKIWRKLSPGPNLESQVLAALGRCDITPELIGVLSTTDGGFELGMFSQRIEQAEDGWDWCVQACRAGRPVDAQLRQLGATLRRLHAELAGVFGTSVVDAADIGAQMQARLDDACAQTPELGAWQPRLRDVFSLPALPIEVQRVHGDFHLGQALFSPSGWTIIDFEGEPLKTPSQRAAPDAVWRDVAGLLRSLDYARRNHQAPDGDQARQWYLQARTAFLGGYLGSVLPPQAMLTAYEVDKAIYELVYETRNRPAWADIPRQAIAEAIGQAG